MFEMANFANRTQKPTFQYLVTTPAVVNTNKVTINDAKAIATGVSVNGFELVTTAPTTGKFKADVAASALTLTFFAGDLADGTNIEVSYLRQESSTVLEIDATGRTSVGEVTFTYPVTASGSDTVDSSLKGYLVVHVFKARVTALPGFDTSYKTASTHSVTIATMDAGRLDGKAYIMAFIPA